MANLDRDFSAFPSRPAVEGREVAILPDARGIWTAAEAGRWSRERVGRSGSSFLWAMRLLPRPRREAIFAVYAFCRAVDDVADGAAAAPEKMAQLAAWRAEVQSLFAGRPRHPATVSLAAPVAGFGLDRAEFLAIIDGMEMDARGHMVAPSLETLELYCRRVAGAVGMLSAAIFGLPRAEGRALALSLGPALQLTNVLRDLAEDAALGRLYLPREVLEAHGIALRRPAEVLSSGAISRACAEVVAMAEGRFDTARRVLAGCPRGPARPARIMLAVYGRLLARLKSRGFAPADVARPVAPGRGEALAAALGACLR